MHTRIKSTRRVWGKPGARIGFVAAGKNWLDLVPMRSSLLGIDAAEARSGSGLTTYKVGQTFPLDMKRAFTDWAEGLDLIIVC